MVMTPNTARYHKELADALELLIEVKALEIQGLKRQRDAHRSMQAFFTPPETPPLGSPLPVIAPPAGPDPDYEDDAPGQEPKPDEATP
jgi:hypothetical protein